MTSALRNLANIVVQAVDTIESTCSKQGLSIPGLDELFTPESGAALQNADIARAATLLNAAAQELALAVRTPHASVLDIARGFASHGALRAALELHVAEILRPAGPAGLPIADIAKKANTDANKLSRVLRILAAHGVFTEVTPEVFANNRLSSVLDKGQDAAILFAKPETKYDQPQSAFAALIGHLTDECAKSAPFLYETLSDPKTAFSVEATEVPFSKAFNTNLSSWDFLELPENKHRLLRFGVAMEGSKNVDPLEKLLSGFDWSSLPVGGKVIDVGGGVGTVSMELAKTQPKLKFVVQDRPPVAADGVKRWTDLKSEALRSGHVTFQGHDFFAPQPVKDAAVFFMKYIIHDWSDPYATKILDQLRAAARSDTKLVLIDRIAPYACRAPNFELPAVPGLVREKVPEPLPPNLGPANTFIYAVDLNMMNLLNGQERTIGHWIALLKASKWKLERVFQIDGFSQFASLLEAVPI